MTSVRDFFRRTTACLAPALGSEAESAARILFEDVAGYDRNYIFVNGDREMLDSTCALVDKAADRVLAGEPVQYAVGSARFMGMDLRVSPAVLIPRPETEGLVDLITDRWGGRSDLSVLDICTGSGCIAIALARALPFSSVSATDISSDAIAIAKDNAARTHVSVDFRKADALRMPAQADAVYDIIVSNPPYVCESEKKAMDSRVLDYEPHIALFVPDADPLRFYKAIARYASAALRPSGMLYFEINPLHATALASMLSAEGFSDVAVLRDYRGQERYATAKK